MPAVKLSPLFNDQQITPTGAPASGYKLYTYVAGSSAQLAAYTDSTGTVAQSNPIVLNSSGYPANPIWLQAGLSYKLVLKDSNDNVIRTVDNISGVNDASGSTSQWQASGLTPTYVSANSFTLSGDQTSEFHVGRRVQCTVSAGTVYGKIVDAVYTTLTTVKVLLDSGSLDSGLSVVNIGLIRADTPAIEYLANHGQCRLTKSGSNLLLSPYNGSRLIIGGRIQTIPAAGVSLSPTGLTAGTLYYIYAYMNSGAIALEASTTGHSTDSTTGVEIKTGDATRTLVGMAWPIAGPAWQDTTAQRFVLPWFNRQKLALKNSFTVSRSTSSLSWVEVNSEIRTEFLVWQGDVTDLSIQANAGVASAGTRMGTALTVDGISVDVTTGVELIPDGTGSYPIHVRRSVSGLSEGYHYATLAGIVSGGTGTWLAGTTAVSRATITGTI